MRTTRPLRRLRRFPVCKQRVNKRHAGKSSARSRTTCITPDCCVDTRAQGPRGWGEDPVTALRKRRFRGRYAWPVSVLAPCGACAATTGTVRAVRRHVRQQALHPVISPARDRRRMADGPATPRLSPGEAPPGPVKSLARRPVTEVQRGSRASARSHRAKAASNTARFKVNCGSAKPTTSSPCPTHTRTRQRRPS